MFQWVKRQLDEMGSPTLDWVQVEVTTDCNAACVYCPHTIMKDRWANKHMPMELFYDLIPYLRHTDLVYLQGWGEPLLNDDLEVLLCLIKERNLLVRIDTNGSFPSRLEGLIEARLVDQIAMDVKAPLERYNEVAGIQVNEENIQKSINMIKNSGLEYVFRTTVVPGLVGSDDIRKISQMLNGAKIFQIQQFVPTKTLDSHYLRRKPYGRKEVQAFAGIAEPYFKEIRLEGV